jgi:sodium/proline symporter
MNADFTILLIVCIYFVLLLFIGYLSSLKTKSREDFFLAGRSLGSWVTAISSTASSESGWVVLGFVGLAYKEGVPALWTAPGCLMGYFLNLYLLAPRLRMKTASLKSLTLPDYISDRFEDKGNLLRITSVIVIFTSLIGYISAQMTAVGKAVNGILSFSYSQGVVVGGVIILIYTLMGGFRAVSYTDFIQGLIMVFAFVLMPIIAIIAVGGYLPLIHKLSAINPDLVTLGGGREGFALFGFVIGLLGIGLGYPGQPHVITRYMAASSDEKIRQSQVIAMVWGVLVFYGAGFLGLCGRILLKDIKDPEQIFPILSKSMLHPIIAGIMLSAILSAIMSTVSSQLLVSASSLSRDLLDRAFTITKKEKTALLASRITILVLGIFSIWVALSDIRIVFWFVLFAWSGLGASFGPLILFSLWTDYITKWGAFSAIVTGFVVTVLWKLSGLSDRLIYELVPAFVLASISAFLFSFIERKLRRKNGDTK